MMNETMSNLLLGICIGLVICVVLFMNVMNSQLAFDGMRISGEMASAGLQYLSEQYVSKQSFDDVPPDHWAYEEINLIYSYGITVGCSYDPPLYCPDRPATRAEMAVFAARISEIIEQNH